MTVWLYTLISVILVSSISLVGVLTLSLNREKLRKITIFLVSLASGGLFGDALLHLLPESFEKLGFGLSVPLYILFGILLFFAVEKFLRWRHCHIPNSEAHFHPVVTMNLVGDAIHNFIDGMVIAASFFVSFPIGIATTLAVILHEIPQEIGDFGIFLHGGLSAKKAITLNILTAITAVFGAIVFLSLGRTSETFALALLPITAGGFLYIAGSDLIPELQHEVKASTSFWQFFLIIAGIGIMALLTLI